MKNKRRNTNFCTIIKTLFLMLAFMLYLSPAVAQQNPFDEIDETAPKYPNNNDDISEGGLTLESPDDQFLIFPRLTSGNPFDAMDDFESKTKEGNAITVKFMNPIISIPDTDLHGYSVERDYFEPRLRITAEGFYRYLVLSCHINGEPRPFQIKRADGALSDLDFQQNSDYPDDLLGGLPLLTTLHIPNLRAEAGDIQSLTITAYGNPDFRPSEEYQGVLPFHHTMAMTIYLYYPESVGKGEISSQEDTSKQDTSILQHLSVTQEKLTTDEWDFFKLRAPDSSFFHFAWGEMKGERINLDNLLAYQSIEPDDALRIVLVSDPDRKFTLSVLLDEKAQGIDGTYAWSTATEYGNKIIIDMNLDFSNLEGGHVIHFMAHDAPLDGELGRAGVEACLMEALFMTPLLPVDPLLK